MSGNVESFMNNWANCHETRHCLDISIETWLKIAPWERLHMDRVDIQQVGNGLIIVYSRHAWIEAFICGYRRTENAIKCLSSAFVQFGGLLTCPNFLSSYRIGSLKIIISMVSAEYLEASGKRLYNEVSKWKNIGSFSSPKP